MAECCACWLLASEKQLSLMVLVGLYRYTLVKGPISFPDYSGDLKSFAILVDPEKWAGRCYGSVKSVSEA